MNHWLGAQRQRAAGTRYRARSVEGDEMAQCPQCKVYVPLSRSVEKRLGGRTYHFCGEDCAKKYLKEIR